MPVQTTNADTVVKVAIIGAGTAGMAAYREVAKATGSIALIDGGPLGTTCARVGCMPSKLLIAAAEACHRTTLLPSYGLGQVTIKVDRAAVMRRIHEERDRFVGFVLEALESFDPAHLYPLFARFTSDHELQLEDGRTIRAESIIIATGSRPAIAPVFQVVGNRLIVNDDVLSWQELPNSIAVFGAGAIGLELGQALHRLGVDVHLFGRDHLIGPLSDPAVCKMAAQALDGEFPAHWHADSRISLDGEQVLVQWQEGESGSQAREHRFDWLLAATGRRANVDSLGLENTSLKLDAGGVPIYDPLSMQVAQSHVFMAGDVTADLPLLHEAADEGRLAGENALRFPHAFRRARRTPMSIVFTDPQLVVVGESYASLNSKHIDFRIGQVSFEDQGRARVMLVDQGLLRVYGEMDTGIFLGAEMACPGAEHLAHLLAWSLQSRLSVTEMLARPFYHPVLEEGLRTALRKLNHELGFAPNPPPRCIDSGPGS